MDGIIILRDFVVKESSLPIFILASIAFCVFILFCFLNSNTSENFTKFIVLFGLGTLGFLAVGILHQTTIKEEKYYDVLIDDSVTVNEFFEHYELEKIDGKIYTVKEIGSMD